MQLILEITGWQEFWIIMVVVVDWFGLGPSFLGLISGESQSPGWLLPRASQRVQVFTAPPFKKCPSPCCCFHQSWHVSSSQACWVLLPTLYRPMGGQRVQVEGQTCALQKASPPTFNKCVFTASHKLITVLRKQSIIQWEVQSPAT